MSERAIEIAVRLGKLCEQLPDREIRFVEGFMEGFEAGKKREEETCRNKENSPD